MIKRFMKWYKSGSRYEQAVDEIYTLVESVDFLRTMQVSYLSRGMTTHAQAAEEVIRKRVRRAMRLNSVVKVVPLS